MSDPNNNKFLSSAVQMCFLALVFSHLGYGIQDLHGVTSADWQKVALASATCACAVILFGRVVQWLVMLVSGALIGLGVLLATVYSLSGDSLVRTTIETGVLSVLKVVTSKVV